MVYAPNDHVQAIQTPALVKKSGGASRTLQYLTEIHKLYV